MVERFGQLGVINLDKPARWSSAKAVMAVRFLLGRRTKIGHAGTLDPAATGVLVLLVGRATKLSELLMDAGKTYLADVRLGATSTTDDADGEISPAPPAAIPDVSSIREILPGFVGQIEQRPPAHSAVKVDGHRAYRLARGGHDLDLPARPVRIRQIELLDYVWPNLRLRVDCGRGTYVRSLARDIGQALGVGGYLAGLRRTRVGPFLAESSADPNHCHRQNIDTWLQPVESAVVHLPRIELSEPESRLLAAGVILEDRNASDMDSLLAPLRDVPPGGGGRPDVIEPVAAFDPRGRLIALVRVRGRNVRPTQVFRPTEAYED